MISSGPGVSEPRGELGQLGGRGQVDLAVLTGDGGRHAEPPPGVGLDVDQDDVLPGITSPSASVRDAAPVLHPRSHQVVASSDHPTNPPGIFGCSPSTRTSDEPEIRSSIGHARSVAGCENYSQALVDSGRPPPMTPTDGELAPGGRPASPRPDVGSTRQAGGSGCVRRSTHLLEVCSQSPPSPVIEPTFIEFRQRIRRDPAGTPRSIDPHAVVGVPPRDRAPLDC